MYKNTLYAENVITFSLEKAASVCLVTDWTFGIWFGSLFFLRSLVLIGLLFVLLVHLYGVLVLFR